MTFYNFLLSLALGYLSPANPTTVSETKNIASEQITWSPERRLTWDDFKAVPDQNNPHHAITAANLAVDANCASDKFSYTVKCVFLATESWTKNKRSEKLLQHEQLHFDLTEVHARQLRKKLLTLGTSCPDANSRLTKTVDKAFTDWKAEQDKFDEASEHGLDAEVSAAWAKSIDQRLKQLEKFRS
jgi:predicted secreted Zn-dependent protease